MKKYALILAGGNGTRLWPISTQKKSKQMLPLISSKPIIFDTINRIKDNFKSDDIFIITNKNQANNIYECVREVLPMKNIIIEPFPNGTASCILYAIMKINDLYGDGSISIFASDHYIDDKNKWNDTVSKALSYIEENEVIATIGIAPTEANINYGYILKDYEISNNIYKVKQFVEKPNKDYAEKFVNSGDYLWNSGNIITKLSFFLELYKSYLPDMYNIMSKIIESNCDECYLTKMYSSVENISIDRGILEKTDKIVTLQTDVNWNDVGTLKNLIDVVNKDEKNNYSNKESLMLETNNTFIYSNDGYVITLGIDNGVIIENNGLIIVTTKDKLEEIKKVAKNDKIKKFL